MQDWIPGSKYKEVKRKKQRMDLDLNTQTLYSETKSLLSNISRWKADVLTDDQYNERLLNHARVIYWLALERSGESRIPPDDQGARDRFILDPHAFMGGLKQCIDAHGPITRMWTRSASKRVIAIMKYRAQMYRKTAWHKELEDKIASTQALVV